jgi:hypothetical protein
MLYNRDVLRLTIVVRFNRGTWPWRIIQQESALGRNTDGNRTSIRNGESVIVRMSCDDCLVDRDAVLVLDTVSITRDAG